MILILLLLPVPPFLEELAAPTTNAIRFGAVTVHLLLLCRFAWGSHVRQISAILLLMFVFACVSMCLGISHSLGNILTILRIGTFGIAFLFGVSLACRGRSNPGVASASCLKLLLAIGVLNALFTLSQYLFPYVTRPLQEWFASVDKHMELLPEQGRAFGFFGDPNTNAVMLLLLSLPGLALFQLTAQRRYLGLGLFVFACVLLTASRTGLILAGVTVSVLCITSRKLKYLVALVAITWGAYEALEFLVETGTMREWFPYLSGLMFKIYGTLHGDYLDLESVKSFQARLTIWESELEWFYEYPIFGAGPLRDMNSGIVDNYYITLLSRYGMIGLALYVLFSVYVAGLSVVAILRRERPFKEWGMLMFTSIVIVNVANCTINAFPSVPIAMVSLLYAGYLASLMDAFQPSFVKSRRGRQLSHMHVPSSKRRHPEYTRNNLRLARGCHGGPSRPVRGT